MNLVFKVVMFLHPAHELGLETLHGLILVVQFGLRFVLMVFGKYFFIFVEIAPGKVGRLALS